MHIQFGHKFCMGRFTQLTAGFINFPGYDPGNNFFGPSNSMDYGLRIVEKFPS